MSFALPRFITEIIWLSVGKCYKYLTRTKIHGSQEESYTNHYRAQYRYRYLSGSCEQSSCDSRRSGHTSTKPHKCLHWTIHAIVSASNTAPQQQVLASMANQIKNLKERIEPSEDVSTPQKSNDGEIKISRSSKRNKRRRKRSKLRKSLSKSKWEKQGASKSETRDARKHLEDERLKQLESVQSFMDKKRDERKMTRLTGFSRPVSPIETTRDDFSRGGPSEVPILLNSPLSTKVLATPDPTKIKVPNMIAFDGTKCPD